MPGQPPDLTNPPPGCRFHPRCPYVFERCLEEVPPEYLMADGGHARCFLNDAEASGERFEMHLKTQLAGHHG